MDKEKAEKLLSSRMTEISLQYMAKSYAVNVMTLRRLALIFEQQQCGRPLTKQEIETVSAANKTLQKETEDIAYIDLCKRLDLARSDAVGSAIEENPGEVQ